MPSFQLIRIRRTDTSGEIWDVDLRPGLNLLIGQPNTSKTTTLRIADFCLGDGQPAREKFGAAIASEYAGFEINLRINHIDHVLTRRTAERGQTTLTDVDGDLEDTQAFNLWIAGELGWGPPLMIPRGRVSASATQEDPLTFRAVYRHLYRRADSWTSFASQEQEYLRRAVVAFLLGVAPEVYKGREVQITRSEQELQALDAERISLRSTLDDIVRRAAEGFRSSGTTSLDSIADTMIDVTTQIDEARTQREDLAAVMRGEPSYDTRMDARLAVLHERLEVLSKDAEQVRETLDSHRRLTSTLDGDLQRLQRARLATAALSMITVSACPACHQPLSPTADDPDSERLCYVCRQPVGEDVRERRLTLEEHSLRNEKLEIESVASKLEERLAVITHERGTLTAEREALRSRIDEERRRFIAPLLQDFERVQFRLGQLEQRMQSLQRLSHLQDYMVTLDARRRAVEQHLAEIRQEAGSRRSDTGLITSRTTRFAALMNEFVDQLGPTGAIGGLVSLSQQDFSFYVGREQWEHALGSERRVLFFLAYHYAYLKLTTEADIPHPGFVILDNPFQHDLDPVLVEDALTRFDELCRDHSNLQVIVAVAAGRELPGLEAHRVAFHRVFNPEPGTDSATEPC